MTGKDYWNLLSYDYDKPEEENRKSIIKCVKHPSGIPIREGDIFHIELPLHFNDGYVAKNVATGSVMTLGPKMLIECFELIDNCEEKKQDEHIIRLPFVKHDEVWCIANNKVRQLIITQYHIASTSGGYVVKYDLIDSRDVEYSLEADKCFATKEELLKSL